MNKICTYCKLDLPIENFTKCKKSKDKLQYYCKACGKDIKKNWREKNSEKHNSYMEEYRQNNREIIKKRGKIFRLHNIEEERERSRIYKKNNPDKVCIWANKRYAIKQNAYHPDHNVNLEKVFIETRRRVSNCIGVYFHVDHILPLSEGGYHHHGNLQVIPGIINETKHTNTNYIHPLLIHWSELPEFLLDRIKGKVPLEQSAAQAVHPR